MARKAFWDSIRDECDVRFPIRRICVCPMLKELTIQKHTKSFRIKRKKFALSYHRPCFYQLNKITIISAFQIFHWSFSLSFHFRLFGKTFHSEIEEYSQEIMNMFRQVSLLLLITFVAFCGTYEKSWKYSNVIGWYWKHFELLIW